MVPPASRKDVAALDCLWSAGGLLPTGSVCKLSLGDAAVIFCERDQKLSQLNETANLIWDFVAEGRSPSEVSKHIESRGVAREHARAFVADALNEWLTRGYLYPPAIRGRVDDAAWQVLTCRFRIGSVAVRLAGDLDIDEIRRALRGLAGTGGQEFARIDVVGQDDVAFIFLNDNPLGMRQHAEVLPQIKLSLTEQYGCRLSEGFLAHGALLSRAGVSIFLSGAPGAGKTTLSLALASSGFDYAGDDVVHIDQRGQALGLCFPAASKSGAWPILQTWIPDLLALPIHERADGKVVRYVAPPQVDALGPRPINIFIALRRSESASARLIPMPPLEGLCTLLASGWCEQHRTRQETLLSLAQLLSSAALYVLNYSELGEAVAKIRALVDA